jgi:large subunit ribosomal protein L10
VDPDPELTEAPCVRAGAFSRFERVPSGAAPERQPPRGYDKLGSAMATKDATVADLQQKFEESTAVLLTEYRGLTVAQLRDLRNSIREHATYAVSKNTLTKIAANNAGITAFDDELAGPSALAFVHGDTVSVAKALRDFAKANPLLVVKAGYFDGNALTAAEVGKLADLESREVLLAKAAGAMQAALVGAAQLFNALPAKAARGFGALQEKQDA